MATYRDELLSNSRASGLRQSQLVATNTILFARDAALNACLEYDPSSLQSRNVTELFKRQHKNSLPFAAPPVFSNEYSRLTFPFVSPFGRNFSSASRKRIFNPPRALSLSRLPFIAEHQLTFLLPFCLHNRAHRAGIVVRSARQFARRQW